MSYLLAKIREPLHYRAKAALERIKELKQPMWGVYEDDEISKRASDLQSAEKELELLREIWDMVADTIEGYEDRRLKYDRIISRIFWGMDFETVDFLKQFWDIKNFGRPEF